MFYPLADSFTSRRFRHFTYILKALKRVNGKILDIGCCAGYLTSAIKKARPDLKITACDKEQKFLDFFKQHLGKEIKIVYGDVRKLPFKDNSFDAVLLSEVLEHLYNPKKALKEIHKVLKKQGIFYMAVPIEKSLATWDGWLYRFFKLNLKKERAGHIHLFTFEEARKMLEDHGFKIVDFYFSQHFLEQFFAFIFYAFSYLFQLKRNSSPKVETSFVLGLLARIGACLANLESGILRKIKGRIAHVICKKSIMKL